MNKVISVAINITAFLLMLWGFFYLLQNYSHQTGDIELDLDYLKGCFLFLFPALILYFFFSRDEVIKKQQNILFVVFLTGFGLMGIGAQLVNFVAGVFGIVALILLVWTTKANK
ncbi:MAG: hypothetical protein V4714_09590 [Bacteroidota bacterium]